MKITGVSLIVNNTDSAPLKRLETAELRLAQAISRLEVALEIRDNANGTAQNITEMTGLRNEIDQLTSENHDLKGLVGQASERLDTTIDIIKGHLATQEQE